MNSMKRSKHIAKNPLIAVCLSLTVRYRSHFTFTNVKFNTLQQPSSMATTIVFIFLRQPLTTYLTQISEDNRLTLCTIIVLFLPVFMVGYQKETTLQCLFVLTSFYRVGHCGPPPAESSCP